MSFDFAPSLQSDSLELRPLAAADRDALHAAASDPATWAGHPATERWNRAVFDPYVDFLLKAGGTLVAIDRASGRIVGCSRFYVPPEQPDGIAIGFTFLDRAFWGGRTNFEMKRLMLGDAFAHVPEVWFHIAPTNIRSQTATGRLGATYVDTREIDLAGSGTPVPNMRFRLDRATWAAKLKERAA
ncbi:MAG: GNAT family N-acetyltransferase [Amaricoccus sp.]|uniref:GNAT family N-acetyltransferase n=1 Tax=Amaricoccus sp. TaxID=1872485 RepID=UPI0039E247D4